MRGGARSAMSVISAISADALRDAAMAAPPASAGPAKAAKRYARQTSDSFGDLKARLLDDNDIARKTEYIMHGNADEILPAYDKMVSKTQTRLAEYVHKLSAELAKEHDPKLRAKLEDNIFSVLVASQATRDKFKAERLRLKAVVKDMRSNPKLKAQASSILSSGVKTAIAVFGVAAISYAGYHYGSKLWANAKVGDGPVKAAVGVPESRVLSQPKPASVETRALPLLLADYSAPSAVDAAVSTPTKGASDAAVSAAVGSAFSALPKGAQFDVKQQMATIAHKSAIAVKNTNPPEPGLMSRAARYADTALTSAAKHVNAALNSAADSEDRSGLDQTNAALNSTADSEDRPGLDQINAALNSTADSEDRPGLDQTNPPQQNLASIRVRRAQALAIPTELMLTTGKPNNYDAPDEFEKRAANRKAADTARREGITAKNRERVKTLTVVKPSGKSPNYANSTKYSDTAKHTRLARRATPATPKTYTGMTSKYMDSRR